MRCNSFVARLTPTNQMSKMSHFSLTGKNYVTSGVETLKQFFSRKGVFASCLIAAILIKTLLTFCYYQLEHDRLVQAMAGKNLVEGHGLTIKQVHANNLSKEYYEPLVGWPPGYSVIIGLTYLLVHDLDISCFIIDVILIILFFLSLCKLFKQLTFPPYLISLLLLFNASLISFYIIDATAADFLTLVIYVYICSLSITLFQNKNAVFNAWVLAVVNALPIWFRYVFFPVSFVTPVFVLWNGWHKKDKQVLKHGMIILAFAMLSTVMLLYVQVPYSKTTSYIAVAERGIYWANLLKLYPFLFSAFLTLDFYLVQAGQLTGFSYEQLLQMLRWINIVLLSFVLIRFFYFSFKKGWLINSPWQAFVLIGGSIGLSTLAVITFMSLTHSGHFNLAQGFIWTYVSEERYFILTEFIISTIVIGWLFIDKAHTFKIKGLLKFIFLLIAFIEIFHTGYFLEKKFTLDRRRFPYIASQKHKINAIEDLIALNKKKNIDVVVAGSLNMANRSILAGGKGLLEFPELNFLEIHAAKPTLLIAIIKKNECPFYQSFLSKPGVQLISVMNDCYFYSYYVAPANPLNL
jgi:hypothetical protein